MDRSILTSSYVNFNAPLITIAMPIFNAGCYLRSAVLSIVNQTFSDWELLIIDDGSTDNALQSINDIKDSRICVLRDGLNKGLAVRLNEAIGIARGRYFARMDQDDVSYPDRFAKQLKLLQNDQSLDVVAASAITISDGIEVTGLLPCPISHEKICARPWQGFCFAHPTWLGKTEWFRKFKYAIPGPYFCEDQELLLRSYNESKFGGTKEILFAYRVRAVRNLKRVLKTRWTLFVIQVRFFICSSKFTFVVLSALVFFALIMRDLWWHCRQEIKFLRRLPLIIDTKTRRKWEKIQSDL